MVIIVSFMTYLFSTVTSPKIVYIPQGSVFKSIAHLQDEGVNLYKIDAFILRLLGQPQQGWIDLKEEKTSRIEYLYKLTTAKAATRAITLIPGETTVIFLRQLSDELSLDMNLLQRAYEKHAPYKEGSFVPDTYSIPNAISEEKLIIHLLNESEQKMRIWADEYKKPYNKEKWLQIVTKASVIQKEAASLSDMPFVSSVIDNRIEKGMRLQMDGTLNYGEYSHQKVTARRIRTDKTPYNTYKNKGLPAFPVCNVSKDAIHAALYPKHTDYLYFVRGKNGEHVYSSYFSTHHQNIVNATK
ncbi:MAG: aminodeoxychorismate lyase [Sulfuricurvum sp. RIFCSPLOWO2_02_FULL_43_45]|nr:MAG: aminodeoxychorismate lyase [Sulfuricurvum sp. RIFCSPHIGHO2_02_FULL_43_9]OHD86769.1 MAG: aminodeoxychorismate lyase [Sulfuricurvum sp. RIFCSPLOWO2_02_FULL_43_45]OHD90665.1 MAG: aminodeoxychorismate lyase [Sulfuricurvum sp. RIFCSPLOWO2_12_FULL_43_24]